MMTRRLPCFLIPLSLAMAAAQAFGAVQPVPCAEKSIVASAVRTPEDIEAFVQCAYEYVQDVGFAEARRAFHEDARWNSGPIYIFVDESTPMSGAARALVFPPDPSREGLPWGPLVDDFASDLAVEANRVASGFGEGWFYYGFTNPATGRAEPKASYVKSIDWEGTSAAIGAGIYRRDIPATCQADEVNAMGLEASPSGQRLQEFVRCAAMEIESKGYFASQALSTDPRWTGNSIYVFGLDMYGNTLFSGDPYSRWFGVFSRASELNARLDGPFAGRDVIGVADAFGETFLYYSTLNPATGKSERKVTFVKRVLTYGLPILVGAGYYLDESP